MTRLHRSLLRLYSRRFREEYGDEALEVLRQDMREARQGTGARRLLLPLWLLFDFALQGVLDRIGRATGAGPSRWRSSLNGWAQDARLALRASLRRPGFFLVAVASLVIGIGANTLVFAVVDTVMWRDTPGVVDPHRVVELRTLRPGGGRGSWSYPDFLDVRDEVGLLEAATMFEMGPMNLSDEESGRQLVALYVTSGYFETLGVRPSRGRTFVPSEDQGPGEHPVAILSHGTWRSWFEADPGIIGRTIRLNREPYTVVGVTPQEFRGHQLGLQPAVYLPLTQYQPVRDHPELFLQSRGSSWGGALARTREGVGIEALRAALATVMDRLAEEHPRTNQGRGATADAAGAAPAEARVPLAVAFAMLAALMLLVLAATCANVGGMLLARASAQERDMAVRLALGSGRARLVRLLLFEAFVIFAAGGAGGVLLTVQGLRLLDPNRLLPTPYPVALEFALDERVLLFGLTLTLGTGLLFGLLPALRVTRDNLAGSLREQSAGNGVRASRLRRVFVGGQVGVSILLLASAGLFLRALQSGLRTEPGFSPDGIYVTPFHLSMEGYGDAEAADVFLRRLLTHLREHPAIAAAAVATDLPLDGGSTSTSVRPDVRGADEDGWIQSDFSRVTEGYFQTLDIPVLAGRVFSPEDGRLTPRVAVVNELYAETAWPGRSPLGRTVEFGLDPASYTVIGVVGNTNTDLVTDKPAPQVFSLLAQDYGAEVHVTVRQARADPGFVGLVRRAILQVDPALALGSTRSLRSLAGLGTLPHRLAAGTGTALGLLALFLSAMGVYGIVAYTVTQRTREIGVRIALGASRGQVLGRVLRGGVMLAAPGFVVGTLLAVALGHVFRAAMVGVEPLDPLTYASVAVILALVVTAACFVPARRAAATLPMDALRHD